MNEKILKNIERLQYNQSELNEYLTDLKNKGILTQEMHFCKHFYLFFPKPTKHLLEIFLNTK